MKRIILFLSTFFTAISLIAQPIAGSIVKKTPTAYLEPTGEIVSKGNLSTKNWKVYSDRDNNTTYKDASTATKFKSAEFMEAFYVIDESGDFLRVVKYDIDILEGDNKINMNPKYETFNYGWIPKSNVLMWEYPLVSDNKFTIKALPIIKEANALKDPTKFITESGLLKLYNSPVSSAPNANQVKMFQFLYVFKKDASGRLLIGKSNSITPKMAKNVILGWVPANIVQEWSDRICLEVNGSSNAFLFTTKEDAEKWQTTGTPSLGVPYKPDPSAPSNIKRLPILGSDRDNPNLVRTGMVTDVFDKGGVTIMDLNQQATMNQGYNKIREKMRRVNVIFVIDVSADMSDFNGPIAKVIEEIGLENKSVDDPNLNKFRYGVVTYSNAGVDKLDLTDNFQKAKSFIEDKKQGSSDESPSFKPVYKGIDRAVRMLQECDENETNIVLIIGSGGDKADPAKEKQIVTDLAAKKASLIAYQVAFSRKAEQAYDAFSDLGSKVMRGVGNSVSETVKKSAKYKTIDKSKGEMQCRFIGPDDNGGLPYVYALDYPNTSPIQGVVKISDPSAGRMEPRELMSIVQNVFNKTSNSIDNNIAELEKQYSGIGSKESVKINPAIIMYLTAIGEETNMDEKAMELYNKGGIQFFIQGYTSLNTKAQNTPVYKRVIFANDDEYIKIKESFQTLIEALGVTSIDQIRGTIVDVMKNLLASYIGIEEANRRINTLTAGELQQIMTGLSTSKTSILNKHKIIDWKDPQIVKNDEIKSLYQYWQDLYDNLSSIQGDSKYVFTEFDKTFYWIPEDIFLEK